MSALEYGNSFPTPMTDRAAVQSLIRRLWPKVPEKGLIRLGPMGDGGYLVPNDLSGIEACFSPGVSLVSGFEKDCADLGLKVYLADKSVDGPPDQHELFHFTKKYIGVTSNADFMTIDDWVASSLPNSRADLILQIDIEGYEYETFLGISHGLMQRLRIIVAEFHGLDQLWNKPFFQVASRALDKILQTHTCVHIHPNNFFAPLKKGGLSIPPVLEFTFIRNDRVSSPSFACRFPNELDSDNTDNVHYALPECWHAGARHGGPAGT